MSWRIQAGEARDGPGHRAAVLELDPRARTATLGWRTLGLGDAEVGSRALFRSPVPEAALARGLSWLRGAEAAALLEQVSAGFTGHVTWSGDPVGEWSVEAWAAAEALVSCLEALCEDP